MFTVERCYNVAEIYTNRGDATDLWCADCWRTMGDWVLAHPEVTDIEQDEQWNIICTRPEGVPYQIPIGGYILLEL